MATKITPAQAVGIVRNAIKAMKVASVTPVIATKHWDADSGASRRARIFRAISQRLAAQLVTAWDEMRRGVDPSDSCRAAYALAGLVLNKVVWRTYAGWWMDGTDALVAQLLVIQYEEVDNDAKFEGEYGRMRASNESGFGTLTLGDALDGIEEILTSPAAISA